jgi:hypothetical protein
MNDITAFFKENAEHDELIVYASLGTVFINTLLVLSAILKPPDYDDLLAWNCNAYDCWGVDVGFDPQTISVAPPLSHNASRTLEKAEQLVFAREFEGRIGEKHYYEVLQKFTQIFGLHLLNEKQAYCRIDEQGDIEDVIRIVEVPESGGRYGGAVITCMRRLVDEYAVLTDSAIVQPFDFTFCDFSRFGGWKDSSKVEHTREKHVAFYSHIENGHGSYRRGVQLIWPVSTKDDLLETFGPGTKRDSRYASFIAHDWKHKVVKELSCNPDCLGNYFVESDLPFETTPAFFRPEVLLKYKADTDKYRVSDRAITCRDAWHLQNYDVNDAGQVHTYLIYLGRLPYQEQLY